MKYYTLIIIILFSVNLFGQTDFNLDSLLLGLEEEVEEPICDTTIYIEKYGDIDYKLIFFQPRFDNKNGNRILIPHSKIGKTDKSIIFSDQLFLSKRILKLGYDTCYVSDFKKKDNKREYIEFVSLPDTANLKYWNANIEFQENHCLDTDYNFVRISKDETNFIDFSCLHNIQVFELDLNKDNLIEIYLISYIWCASEIRIYRIDNKQESSNQIPGKIYFNK